MKIVGTITVSALEEDILDQFVHEAITNLGQSWADRKVVAVNSWYDQSRGRMWTQLVVAEEEEGD